MDWYGFFAFGMSGIFLHVDLIDIFHSRTRKIKYTISFCFQGFEDTILYILLPSIVCIVSYDSVQSAVRM
jgi:hypothetical protein